jgi:hypothetical protein
MFNDLQKLLGLQIPVPDPFVCTFRHPFGKSVSRPLLLPCSFNFEHVTPFFRCTISYPNVCAQLANMYTFVQKYQNLLFCTLYCPHSSYQMPLCLSVNPLQFLSSVNS